MDMTRKQIARLFNNSNLISHLDDLKKQLLVRATGILNTGAKEDEDAPQSKLEKLKTFNCFMLNHVGPAAAESAVSFTINHLKSTGKLRDVTLNGNYVHNVQAIHNLDGECPDFSNVLRQFLLPRYAYLDFDRIVDPRHMIDYECGYPKFITPIMYRYLYDRDDVARRVVDIYPDECWASDPDVSDDQDEKVETPFKTAWKDLCESHNLLSYLYRMDRLAGIGHYGALLLGVDDGGDLESPIAEPELLKGIQHSVATKQRNLLYLRPFDEYLSFIHMYETDTFSPRYGLPKFYNLVFLDMTIDAAGASIGTRLNRRVHWTRVQHIADNLQGSLVFGTPRMQPVFNRLLDLRKIKGSSAEMFWKGGFPGIAFEIDPQFVADDPEFDKATFDQEIDDYASGLKRYLRLVGIKANSLAPTVADPSKHVAIQLAAISGYMNVPDKIFMGTESGRLQSKEDSLNWNKRLGKRNLRFINPTIIKSLVWRFVAIGLLPPPKDNKLFIRWPDLNMPTDEDKANLALKWTQALSQYVATGIIHMIQPLDYMTLILGISPSDALRLDAEIKSNGGYEMLKKVDPSEAGGVNGKRKNIADGDDSGDASEGRKKKRDSNDKKIEGSSS